MYASAVDSSPPDGAAPIESLWYHAHRAPNGSIHGRAEVLVEFDATPAHHLRLLAVYGGEERDDRNVVPNGPADLEDGARVVVVAEREHCVGQPKYREIKIDDLALADPDIVERGEARAPSPRMDSRANNEPSLREREERSSQVHLRPSLGECASRRASERAASRGSVAISLGPTERRTPSRCGQHQRGPPLDRPRPREAGCEDVARPDREHACRGMGTHMRLPASVRDEAARSPAAVTTTSAPVFRKMQKMQRGASASPTALAPPLSSGQRLRVRLASASRATALASCERILRIEHDPLCRHGGSCLEHPEYEGGFAPHVQASTYGLSFPVNRRRRHGAEIVK